MMVPTSPDGCILWWNDLHDVGGMPFRLGVLIQPQSRSIHFLYGKGRFCLEIRMGVYKVEYILFLQ